MGGMGSTYVDHVLLLAWVHLQGSGSEAEQLEFEPMHISDDVILTNLVKLPGLICNFNLYLIKIIYKIGVRNDMTALSLLPLL